MPRRKGQLCLEGHQRDGPKGEEEVVQWPVQKASQIKDDQGQGKDKQRSTVVCKVFGTHHSHPGDVLNRNILNQNCININKFLLRKYFLS